MKRQTKTAVAVVPAQAPAPAPLVLSTGRIGRGYLVAAVHSDGGLSATASVSRCLPYANDNPADPSVSLEIESPYIRFNGSTDRGAIFQLPASELEAVAGAIRCAIDAARTAGLIPPDDDSAA